MIIRGYKGRSEPSLFYDKQHFAAGWPLATTITTVLFSVATATKSKTNKN